MKVIYILPSLLVLIGVFVFGESVGRSSMMLNTKEMYRAACWTKFNTELKSVSVEDKRVIYHKQDRPNMITIICE